MVDDVDGRASDTSSASSTLYNVQSWPFMQFKRHRLFTRLHIVNLGLLRSLFLGRSCYIPVDSIVDVSQFNCRSQLIWLMIAVNFDCQSQVMDNTSWSQSIWLSISGDSIVDPNWFNYESLWCLYHRCIDICMYGPES